MKKSNEKKDSKQASLLFDKIIKASVKDNPKPKEKKTKAKK